MSVGNGAGYLPLRRLDDGISQAAQYWGGLAFQKGMKAYDANLEREKEDRKRKQQERDGLLKEITGVDTKPFSVGVKDVDIAIAKATESLVDNQYRLMKTVLDPNSTQEEIIEARLEMQKMKTALPRAKEMMETLRTTVDTNRKGLENGSLLRSDDYDFAMEDAFDNGNNNAFMNVVWDKNYNPIFVPTDSEGKALRITSFQDMVNQKLPELHRNMDIDAMVLAERKNVGLSTTKNDKGFWTHEETTIRPEAIEALNQRAESLFRLDENGRATDALYNIWTKSGRNIKDLDEHGIETIRTYYKDQVLAGVDLKSGKTFDYGSYHAGQRLKMDKDKENRDKPTIETMTDANGKAKEVVLNVDGKEISGMYGFTFGGNKQVVLENSKAKTIQLTGVYTDGKEFYADVVESKLSDSQQIDKEITDLENKSKNTLDENEQKNIQNKIEHLQSQKGKQHTESKTRRKLNYGEVNGLAQQITNPKTGNPFKNQGDLMNHLNEQLNAKQKSKDTKNKQKPKFF